MLIDEVLIKVCAGRGGNGCISFHREKYRPLGGPDGGDGGKGGDVIFRGNLNLKNLRDIQKRRYYKAENGRPGEGNNKKGKDGENLIIEVPLGTQIYDVGSQNLIADIIEDKEEVVVAYGGKGGRGNSSFANSRNRAPRFAQEGEEGEIKELKLILKLIAEVGIIGYPNVGKSTLLKALSRAKPKIADYPFTTLSPNLGVVNIEGETTFTVADMPGIIEGASQGSGLGYRFLRHIERVYLILHVVEANDPQAITKYNLLNQELRNYDEKLLNKPQIIVVNKIDLLKDKEIINKLKRNFSKIEREVVFVSGLLGKNIKDLIRKIKLRLEKIPKSLEKKRKTSYKEYKIEEAFRIYRKDDYFILESKRLERLIKEIEFKDLSQGEYWHQIIDKMGINKALKEKGAKEGDLVKIGEFEFEFYP
jgi:GTP-binding protein